MNIDTSFLAGGAPVPDERPRVALIAGPTASGKSALAVALAKALEADGGAAVVINADASQVYRDLAVLSARPTLQEMQSVPHRLFGHVDGAHDHHAVRWAEEAKAEIAAAHRTGAIPILVGGTGLHIRTLLNGIAPVPAIAPDVRDKVRAMPVAAAHAVLEAVDPQAAARLNPADTTRVQRALEVILSTGMPMSAWHRRTRGGIAGSIALNPLLLLPPRDWLMDRCDRRFAGMVESAAAQAEVAALVARDLPPMRPVMRAIGVRELTGMLAGTLTREQAVADGQLATRRYAKRQYTWFRNQSPADWPRFTESLNDDNMDHLVIKLRQNILTG